jgi:exopolyphosphatase/guanosine-5'-triphosphate,3'-diphosphate pyrophosphatase
MTNVRLAAIDIGSNTVHLLVLQCEGGDRFKHVLEKSRLLRLGLLEERKGSLPDFVQASIRRTLESFVRQAREAGASTVLVGATAALREDPQRQRIAARLAKAVGVPVRIISKKHEIELGFLAARHDLRPIGRQIFVDSGGASTEITLCQGRSSLSTASLAVGASKLSVLLDGDPPDVLSVVRVAGPIHSAMQKAPPTRDVRAALFSGGTAHHICVVAGATRLLLTRAALERALRHLLRKPARKIARKYNIDVRRVPLLVPGALILAMILDHYGLDRVAVTPATIRDGMIRAYLKWPNDWWRG